MIKFKQGYITNHEGVTKDVVVKAAVPNTLKDMLIGGSMVLIGIAYLTVTAFKHGSKTFDNAEFDTLVELGLVEKLDE